MPADTRYTWAIPTYTGTVTGGVSGSNIPASISGSLLNRTNTTQTATYMVGATTLSAGCVGKNFTIIVTVPPTAEITTMSTVICSGTTFVVTPTNAINGIVPAGTLYTWSVPNSTGSITGGISVSNYPMAVTGSLFNRTNTAQTVTYSVIPSSGACTGAAFTVVVTLYATPEISQMNGIVPSNTLYSWDVPSYNAPIFGGQSETDKLHIFGNLNTLATIQVEAYYRVTPRLDNCVGSAFTLTVFLCPVPAITEMSTVTCSGSFFSVTPTDGVNGLVPVNTVFRWNLPTTTATITGGQSGQGQSIVFGVLRNTMNTTQTATYVVIPNVKNCGDGPAFTVTVTIPPTAEISTMSAVTCSGVAFVVTPTNITNGIVPAGTVYSWSAPSLTGTATGGLSATNYPTIVTGNLLNRTNTVQTATYIVTPTSGSCTGASFSVIVTLNPTPEINNMGRTTCNGVPFNASPVNGGDGIVPLNTLYSWNLPSYTGSITGGQSDTDKFFVSGTLSTSSVVSVEAYYRITPRLGNCTGSIFTLTVYLNPTPAINAMSAVTCSGTPFVVTPTNIVNGLVPVGTVYRWDPPTFTASITGGQSAFGQTSIFGTLRNTVNSFQTATYVVIPSIVNCGDGVPFTVTVVLAPKPEINSITTTICSGFTFTVNPTNGTNGIVPAGTTYTWSEPIFTGTVTGGASVTNNPTTIYGKLLNRTNIAQTVTYNVLPYSGNCPGSPFTVNVTLYPVPEITTMSSVTCSGQPFVVTPTNEINGIVPNGTVYKWGMPTYTASITGGQTAANQTSVFGSLRNSVNSLQTATYIVTPSISNCGDALSFTVIVTIPPTAEITTITRVTCSGVPFVVTPTNGVNGIVPNGTLFSWLAPSFTGTVTGGIAVSTNPMIVTGNLLNRTNTVQTVTYYVTPISGECTGAQFTVLVTLYPTPEITEMSRVTCSGVPFVVTPTNGVNGIVPAGTLYTWSLPSFTGSVTGGTSGTNVPNSLYGSLLNRTNSVQTITYLVTPSTTSVNCTGANFTVIVVLQPKAEIQMMTTVTFSTIPFVVTPTNGINGIVPDGSSYSWNLPNFSASITGGATATNYPLNVTGTLVNKTNTTQTATYLVTPYSGECVGAAFTTLVYLDPIPEITAMSVVTCSGVTFVVTPTNNTNGIVPADTRYSWSVPTFTGTVTGGVSASNVSTIIFGTLLNRTNSTQTVTYFVTPNTASGAFVGKPFTIIVTLPPTAEILTISTVTCSGFPFVVTPTNDANGIVPNGTVYTWNLPVFTGSVTGGASATNYPTIVTGTLFNKTNTAQAITYTITPTSGNCIGAAFTLNVTLNPTPEITPMSTVTCSGVPFVVTPTNGLNGIVPVGTTFSWSMPTTTATMTGGASASNVLYNVLGTLRNTVNTTQTATYIVTPNITNCGDGKPFTLVVTLPPTAEITTMSTVTCSGTPFVVTPTNGTNGIVPAGTVYSWMVPSYTGTVTGGASASNIPTIVYGSLLNRTNTVQTVTYTILPNSVNCAGAAFTVVVTLNPTPEITAMSTVTCSGVLFVVTPVNNTNGIVPAATKYSWAIPTTTFYLSGGVADLNKSSIFGTLNNSTNIQQSAVYIISPAAGNCEWKYYSCWYNL
ncbi:MAG: hypothetical protein EBX50_11995 [Chitinophagia bacterium]|nr:hypothetical protein [Chitinophagia bacterium]